MAAFLGTFAASLQKPVSDSGAAKARVHRMVALVARMLELNKRKL
ncbi:MAG TPA: hypothetical protein VM182_14815 [Terriglobia bacterium]|nr:hypothetical protein [Terriglobia bacterium]